MTSKAMAVTMTCQPWLREIPATYVPNGEELAASRDQYFEALRLYHQHVSYVMTLLLAAPVAAGALLTVATPPAKLADLLPKLGGAALVATFPIALVAVVILKRYYEVYVSSLIFAVQLHIRAGVHRAHPWFVRTVNQARDSKATTVADFLRKRTVAWRDTYFQYSLIVLAIALACGVAGLFVLGRL